MRGIRPGQHFIHDHEGITPACAGNTAMEYEEFDIAARITPACAGNTAAGRGLSAFAQDHPRVCGEYQWDALNLTWEQGSPPRVRGIRRQDHRLGARAGITPACAGNTLTGRPKKKSIRDHPRVCGEYIGVHSMNNPFSGSPPRVRGIHKRGGQGYAVSGITPACAGNTRGVKGAQGLLEDHPRVCGEYMWFTAAR